MIIALRTTSGLATAFLASRSFHYYSTALFSLYRLQCKGSKVGQGSAANWQMLYCTVCVEISPSLAMESAAFRTYVLGPILLRMFIPLFSERSLDRSYRVLLETGSMLKNEDDAS
jgi:hypothetical protein